jgi:DNA invertase Pin-like site-specific DNA recombinase
MAVFAEYIDDGISGTTFERNGFKRMIADIDAGKINAVLCKDANCKQRIKILV